jgi:hypothetical protein
VVKILFGKSTPVTESSNPALKAWTSHWWPSTASPEERKEETYTQQLNQRLSHYAQQD